MTTRLTCGMTIREQEQNNSTPPYQVQKDMARGQLRSGDVTAMGADARHRS